MSVRSAHDVCLTRASTWRDAFDLEHELRSASSSASSTTLSSDSSSSQRLTRRRSVGPVWCDHLDRSSSLMIDPKVADPKPQLNRWQSEAIPSNQPLDRNGLPRSQAWDFEASDESRQDRMKRRLGKDLQPTKEYEQECLEAGLGPVSDHSTRLACREDADEQCQSRWRMDHQKVACERPQLPGGAFCSLVCCSPITGKCALADR